ncbi:MAG: zinc metallopeptidase [Planctomycetaceae bacterium]
MFINPIYLLYAAPAMLLMAWAQSKVKSSFSAGMRVSAPLSGAAAARHILDSEGLYDVGVELTQGYLSDHYDPSDRVLRLSPDVYNSRSAAAVGIAAHEAGHALQHAHSYMPLILRNAAVPAARFGPIAFVVLVFAGMFIHPSLIWVGIACYGAVLVFQLVNLPVEFDASNRAKALLTNMGIVDAEGAAAVRSVLNAAAWTYVAATLQTLMTILYYVMQFTGGRSDD